MMEHVRGWTSMGLYIHFRVNALSQEIYTNLEEPSFKMQLQGSPPGFQWLSQEIQDDGKANTACTHSERLDISCALLDMKEGDPILLVKNACICNERHIGWH